MPRMYGLFVQRMSTAALWKHLENNLIQLSNRHFTMMTQKREAEMLSECRDMARELKLRGTQLQIH